MARTTELMNYNLVNANPTKESYLPQIELGIVKVSLANGSYAEMKDIYDREILPASCFKNQERYKGQDNIINILSALKKEYVKERTEFEEIPSKTI